MIEKIKDNFCKVINSGRAPHAVLIEGGSEDDRKSVAHFFAQTFVCGEEKKPCGACKNCLKAVELSHPDIIEIKGGDGARSFHIDEVRRVKSEAYIVPNEAEKKVFLLINAQTMSEQAQNALLKVLEEPPEYAVIILTCDSRISLLPTVLSRMTSFDLGIAEDESVTDEKRTKAKKIASKFISAMNSINELELLCVTGELEKDKHLLGLCITEITLALRDALRIKSNKGEPVSSLDDGANHLALNFTTEQMLGMMNVLADLKISIDKNANNNIMITRLCSGMRKAAGK